MHGPDHETPHPPFARAEGRTGCGRCFHWRCGEVDYFGAGRDHPTSGAVHIGDSNRLDELSGEPFPEERTAPLATTGRALPGSDLSLHVRRELTFYCRIRGFATEYNRSVTKFTST